MKGIEKKPRKRFAGQTANSVFCFVRAAVSHAISTELWSGGNPSAIRRGGLRQLEEGKGAAGNHGLG